MGDSAKRGAVLISHGKDKVFNFSKYSLTKCLTETSLGSKSSRDDTAFKWNKIKKKIEKELFSAVGVQTPKSPMNKIKEQTK